MILEKLQIIKTCQDVITYNGLEIDESWLLRNEFKKISIQNKPYNNSEYEKLIILDNDDNEIILDNNDKIDLFFNKFV